MKNLKINILSKTAKYTSFALKGPDYLLSKPNDNDGRILFIIGAPRSGSTILYQVLTNYLDVLYLDNLAQLFYRNLPFGMWLSQKKYSNDAHDCYRSTHGNTMECGLHAPSEGGPFWRRVLPTPNHYLGFNEIENMNITRIKTIINPIIKKYQKPLVIKNLVLSQRLKVISELFPSAKIVFVRRNPLDNAVSIFKARKKIGVKKGEWWSVKPKNFMDLIYLNEYEIAVKQIYFIEKQIVKDLSLFPPENIVTLNYDHCIDDRFDGASKSIKNVLEPIDYRKEYKPIEIEERSGDTETGIVSKLNSEIGKLDWEKYGN